ncbi:hypothetical protein OUZ56_005542 [Daphnia magna]|uniref:Uncharacterized protein n=1 Tax=Daphnia magna TaxID=35525 RepID=A0ABQ9YUE1_9CRUS|nr:hypothetical protein OUZ56_005542 [Daphnia magna]
MLTFYGNIPSNEVCSFVRWYIPVKYAKYRDVYAQHLARLLRWLESEEDIFYPTPNSVVFLLKQLQEFEYGYSIVMMIEMMMVLLGQFEYSSLSVLLLFLFRL